MSTLQGLTLHEWIYVGQEVGRIRQLLTVVLVSRFEECEALAWIADIANGKVTEDDAIQFMERAIQYCPWQCVSASE